MPKLVSSFVSPVLQGARGRATSLVTTDVQLSTKCRLTFALVGFLTLSVAARGLHWAGGYFEITYSVSILLYGVIRLPLTHYISKCS